MATEAIVGLIKVFMIYLIGAGGLFVYFAPFMLANSRKHRQTNAILVVNFLLGWTVLGWIIALIWSLGPAATFRALTAKAWFQGAGWAWVAWKTPHPETPRRPPGPLV